MSVLKHTVWAADVRVKLGLYNADHSFGACLQRHKVIPWLQ